MQKITISGSAELLAVLPFHLGFRPSRSAVLVCVHGRRLGLVARLDVCPFDEAVETAAQVLPALRAESPDHVILIGYEDVPGESAALCDALVEALAGAVVELRDRLVVRGDRWYAVGGAGHAGEGGRLLGDADVPGVATYVALGKAVLPDRDSLAALMDPCADQPALSRAIYEFAGRLEWAREQVRPPAPGAELGTMDDSELTRLVDEAAVAWVRLLRGASEPEDPQADLPALVGCLRDVAVRDSLIALLCPGTLHPDDLDPWVMTAFAARLGPHEECLGPSQRSVTAPPIASPIDSLVDWLDGPSAELLERPALAERLELQGALEALCRSVPGEHLTPLLSVVASYAWWCGDGARASVALERALELEPDHRLCGLLRRMVGLGIRPERATA